MTSRIIQSLLLCSLVICALQASAELTGHQRLINLKGTQNTRDIGGYETKAGQHVRWGKIIRSDHLSRLKKDDFQTLEDMGLRTIIDLRTAGEAKRSPTVWIGDNPPDILNIPIGKDDGEWFRVQDRFLSSGKFTEEDSLNLFVEGYRSLAQAGLESYSKLMAVVVDESNWPLLIHCSAGKDRSGVAIALILEAVGVDRETIMEDYLLTNEAARTEEQASILSKEQSIKSRSAGSRIGRFRAPRPAAYFPMVGVTPEMLNGFYAGVEADFGSVDAYLTALGLDPAEREALVLKLTR